MFELSDGLKVMKDKTRCRHLSKTHLVIRHAMNRGLPLRCWCCGISPTHVIERHSGKKNPYKEFVVVRMNEEGFREFNADHIIPQSIGGSNHIDNLRLSCADCNHKRADKIEGDDLSFMITHEHLFRGTIGRRLTQGRQYYIIEAAYNEAHYVY